MLKLFAKIGLVLLSAFILSTVIDVLYRHAYSLEYSLPKNIFSQPEIVEKYEIVKVGNSHAEDGLTFDGYTKKSLSLASVAQSFEYDLAMLKMYSRQIKKGSVIIINVSPLSFSQKKPGPEEDVNMNYYDGRLSPLLIPHLKVADYLQIQIVPFIRAGYLWREKYAKEVKQQAMNSFAEGWKKPENKQTIQAPTPIKTDSPATSVQKEVKKTESIPVVTPLPKNPDLNVAQIQSMLADRPEEPDENLQKSARFIVEKWHTGDFGTQYFETNRKDLEEVIAYCLKNKWQPVLITLPLSQVLLDSLEPNYLQDYVYDQLAIMNLQDVKYFDFASNKQLTKNKSFFSNSDHLNKKGAAVVSYLLLQKLIEEEYLPKEADGYNY